MVRKRKWKSSDRLGEETLVELLGPFKKARVIRKDNLKTCKERLEQDKAAGREILDGSKGNNSLCAIGSLGCGFTIWLYPIHQRKDVEALQTSSGHLSTMLLRTINPSAQR